MIQNFVKISIFDSSKGIQRTSQTQKSIVLEYPCKNKHVCTPYVLELSKGVYKFECWGSKGSDWKINEGTSTPGLGAYTSGTLFVPKRTKFYVYIGNDGFFNAVKEVENDLSCAYPGGATDVRMNISEKWWDSKSLISRIMVAAGGGGAEWLASIGGNGGELTGGESTSASDPSKTQVYKEKCQGATQISGSKCSTLTFENIKFSPFTGEFGSAGKTEPYDYNGNDDYGGFGGGGYYGGTSYQFAFAGSGGSSFISGHAGCNAVGNQTESIKHTNQPNHYSGFVFTNTEMISGGNEMPLPNDPTKRGIHYGNGAFRITLLYHYQYTSTQPLHHPRLFL